MMWCRFTGRTATAALACVLLGGTAASALTHVRSLAGPIPSVFGSRLLPLGGTQALISAPHYCSGGTVCTGFQASGAAYRVDVTSGVIAQASSIRRRASSTSSGSGVRPRGASSS